MHDGSISTSNVIAAALWTLAFVILGSAWIVWLSGHESAALMIATTAVINVAAAGVAQVRCYSLRLGRLIRATADQGERSDASVRSLR